MYLLLYPSLFLLDVPSPLTLTKTMHVSAKVLIALPAYTSLTAHGASQESDGNRYQINKSLTWQLISLLVGT